MNERLEFTGFIDVHVHFRDPGVPEAETTASGLKAAQKGGFGGVVVMPNTMPPIDSAERVRAQYEKAAALGALGDGTPSLPVLLSSGCITKGRAGIEVADLEAMAEAGAVFFTDDGTYVSNAKVMEEAMRRAYDLNMVVSQHALAPGVSEAEAIKRDLSLCRVTGCRLHIQHISTAPGVELIRAAVKEGLPVTAEATPHHLLLTREDIPAVAGAAGDGTSALPTFFKMAPPLAGREDRAELRKAVKEGLLMFATDHAPHPLAKKLLPYEEAANGIIGLETAIPITYQVMVEEEGMAIEDWAKAWWEKPRTILRMEQSRIGDLRTVVEIGEERVIDTTKFVSLSRNCPYHGMKFKAWPKEVI